MPIHRLAHYNIRAERELVEVLRDFYVTVVGLRAGPRPLRSFGYWLYAGELDILHLSEATAADKRRIGSDLTFDHVAFECENWPEFRGRLERHSIAFSERSVAGSGRRQVFFRDPAGNGIELVFPASEP
jgi:catechol 2,3-dioxygenase-like lactoylglutathione lyase family enzyme